MPLSINVKPYDLMGSVGGDNYLTHYKARNDSGDEFLITEFFPAYMAKRGEDGTLEISDRFEREFVSDREAFVVRAEALKEMRDASLHPVIDVFEKNHTAYIVRRACGLTTVDQYMGHQTMDYEEAYFFTRPLILSLAQATEKGTVFNISSGDFRVNSFKQLVLASPPSWDNNFHPTIAHIGKLFYRLVTGVEPPEHSAPAFSAYGLEVPARVEAFIMEIVGGDILYGSLDDFYKKFKSLVENTQEVSQDDGKKSLSFMKGTIAVLFVLFVASLALLAFGVVNLYRVNNSFANPENFADAAALPPPEFDFSDTMLTHPRNTADVLSGSIATYGGYLLFRGEGGLYSRLYAGFTPIPGAAMVNAASDRLIVEGATPASIVGYDGLVYFIDVANGGVIYSITPAGADLTRVTDYPALNLAVVNDYLFYTDVRRGHALYRMNLYTGGGSEHISSRPVYATVGVDDYLFYFAGAGEGQPAALYSWNIPEARLIRIADDATPNIRVSGTTLFYVNTAGRVQSVTFEGRRLTTLAPDNVRTFDVFMQWLFFTEEGNHVPRAYNMNTGQLFTLSTTEWISYMWAHEGQIYAIDHRNPMLVHGFNFPS